MKKLFLVSLVLAVTYSCNYSKSFNKDFTTGMSVVGDGISCNDVTISVGEKAVGKPVFNFGDKLTFTFSGLEGFEVQGGKFFPGLEMTIKDLEGNVVSKLDDLFADLKGGASENSKDVKASLDLLNPIYSGQKFKLEVLIWDKKGKGKLTANLTFEILGNEAVEVSGGEGFSYNEVYLFSENNQAVISNNIITSDDKISLMVDGLTGLEETEGMVFPIVVFTVADSEGNLVFASENMFPNNVETGINAEDFTKGLTLTYNKELHQGLSEVNLHIEIIDQATEKSMVIDTKVTIK